MKNVGTKNSKFAGVENTSKNFQHWNRQVQKTKYTPVNTVCGNYNGILIDCPMRLKEHYIAFGIKSAISYRSADIPKKKHKSLDEKL